MGIQEDTSESFSMSICLVLESPVFTPPLPDEMNSFAAATSVPEPSS